METNQATKLRFGQAGEHRMVYGEKPMHVAPREIKNATLNGIVEYVRSNANDLKERAASCYFEVDNGNSCIELFVNEGDNVTDKEGHCSQGATISGAAKLSRDAEYVLGLLTKSHDDLHALAMSLRNNPQVFPSLSTYKDTVAKLRNVRVSVTKMAQEVSSDAGDRQSQFEQKVNNATELEFGWTFTFPLFEGETNIDVPVSMLYDASRSVMGVSARMFCVDLADRIRKERKRVMDAAIAKMAMALGTTDGAEGPDLIPFVEVSHRPDADDETDPKF